MKKTFAGLMIFAMAGLLIPALSIAQETEDHQAIRTLFQTEQEGWRNGDGAQVLSCYAKGHVAYGVPLRNNAPNFLQAGINPLWNYEQLKQRLLAPDFEGMKTALADTVINMSHWYELNHINVQGTEGVAVSTIAWAANDTLRNVRVQQGHQTMWLLRKIDGKWKYVGSVAAVSAYREENPMQN